jgi:hypothetical protein
MNPYLENPDLWSEVHHRLITAIAIAISPTLRPQYRVAIEKRTYRLDTEDSLLIGIPDVAILSVKQAQKPSIRKTAIATLPTETENRAITVTLPLPLEIKEGYLLILNDEDVMQMKSSYDNDMTGEDIWVGDSLNGYATYKDNCKI